MLDVLRSTPKGQIKTSIDGRGRQLSINKYKHLDLVTNYIESFNPTISHYRREHAPNVKIFAKRCDNNFHTSEFFGKIH